MRILLLKKKTIYIYVKFTSAKNSKKSNLDEYLL